MTAALFLVTACATTSYPTNVPIAQASSVFGAIGPMASSEGFTVNTQPQRLYIKFDEATEIQYVADPEFTNGPNILIGVMVDDGKVGPGEVDGRRSAASQKAYEWLKKATASAPAPSPAPAVAPQANINVNVQMKVEAPPAVTVASKSCQKLLDCHAALAATFCQAGGGECQFKIEISGMDDAACAEALPDVRLVVEPLKMTMPGFTMPAACL